MHCEKTPTVEECVKVGDIFSSLSSRWNEWAVMFQFISHCLTHS